MQPNEKRPVCGGAASQNYLTQHNKNQIDFQAINRAALGASLVILPRWLPDGKRIGNEWVAKNPRRADQHAGSFSINLATGRWADFASDARGGDIISLAAYLADVSQGEAARRVAAMLGMEDTRYGY
ncbi:MAG: hypothetical protein WCD70_11250 [Alphaproteobacteria bacterium]